MEINYLKYYGFVCMLEDEYYLKDEEDVTLIEAITEM